MKFLVYGGTGWIGEWTARLLRERGHDVVLATARMQDREDVQRELDQHAPDRVVCAAGLTGRPNVDWCETHRVETIRTNVVGTLTLADLCRDRGIHLTLFATGCTFEYDEDHPIGSGIGFTEDDRPNFYGSYYSATKGVVEDLLREFENVLILRVRMPISANLDFPRNFIAKIMAYDKICSIPNSMTVLDELLPIACDLAERGEIVGPLNFTNPGVISHNEILELIRDHLRPGLKWTNFSLEEQAKVIKAARSNNLLDTTRLQRIARTRVLPIRESLLEYVCGSK